MSGIKNSNSPCMIFKSTDKIINYLKELFILLNISPDINTSSKLCTGECNTIIKFTNDNCPGIYEEFKKITVNITSESLFKKFPSYIWELGVTNARSFLTGMIKHKGKYVEHYMLYSTYCQQHLDDIQKLALHCGYSGTIKKGKYVQTININISSNEPMINQNYVHDQDIQDEKWIDYRGQVMCIEVPETHLFYVRESKFSPPSWTGNSSRAG
jgi:hypothetical protein